MKVEVYKSYGVLAHEKVPFYSEHVPASEIYDKMVVDISDDQFEVAENEAGDTIIRPKNEKYYYMLRGVLISWRDRPVIRWRGSNGKSHRKAVEEEVVY